MDFKRVSIKLTNREIWCQSSSGWQNTNFLKIEPNPVAEYKETLEQGGMDELSERK